MNPNRGLAVAALACLALLAGPVSAASGSPLAVPSSLATPAEQLETGLREVSEAESLDRARSAHQGAVEPHASTLAPVAGDLADRQGDLLVSYLDQLAASLAAGNLSDARSLAGAAANLVEDEIRPAAKRWETNRTAVGLGPVRWQDGTPTVAVVLANPPSEGLGAFDVTVRFDAPATPIGAELTVGQGDTRVDEANRSVRAASFDARSLAQLDGDQRAAQALVEITLEPQSLQTGENLSAHVDVDELATGGGQPTPGVGLSGSREVPAPEEGLGLSRGWLALAGVAAGAGGLVYLGRRWEI